MTENPEAHVLKIHETQLRSRHSHNLQTCVSRQMCARCSSSSFGHTNSQGLRCWPPASGTPIRQFPPPALSASATPTRQPPGPSPRLRPRRLEKTFALSHLPQHAAPPAATTTGPSQQQPPQEGTGTAATVRGMPPESTRESLLAVKAYEQQLGPNILRGKMDSKSLPANVVPPEQGFSTRPVAPEIAPGAECGYNMAVGLGPGPPCSYDVGSPMVGENSRFIEKTTSCRGWPRQSSTRRKGRRTFYA